MRWSDRARERLRDGETVEEAIPVGGNGVVVTNQRLLAFTPEGEGANFRAIERPNVEGATLRHVGDAGWLAYTGKGALAGVVGVGIGLTVDFGGLFSLGSVSNEGASAVGAGGMMRILGTISSVMGRLDDALLVGGLVALAFTLGTLGMYVQSRSYNLVVGVAGDDDLHVRAPTEAEDQDRELARALDLGGGDGPAPPDDPIPADG